MNKAIIFLLSILILLPVASAITIDNPQQTFVFDNVTVNFSSNQTYDSIELGTDYISLSGSIFQIIPSSDSLNVTIAIWNTTGDYYKKWNESSSNASVTTQHTIGDFPSNTGIQIKKNGANWNTFLSNSTGYISFTYSGGYSDIQFETELNYVNFSFTNKSISETQIYQSSQSTQIKVDVNDSGGYISNVSVGLTFAGVETNYSMSGGNDTWIYDFKSGVPGLYSITHFYATDNASGTNSTTSTLQFWVVPLITGGTGVATTPTPTASPTPLPDLIMKTVTTPQPQKQISPFANAPINNIGEQLAAGAMYFNMLGDETQWAILIVIFLMMAFYSSTGTKKKRR